MITRNTVHQLIQSLHKNQFILTSYSGSLTGSKQKEEPDIHTINSD